MKSFRIPVAACIHPETYKYFLAPEHALKAWSGCSEWLGRPIQRNPVLPLIEIDAAELLMRGPERGSPITVIRKERFDERALARLHALFEFEETEP